MSPNHHHQGRPRLAGCGLGQTPNAQMPSWRAGIGAPLCRHTTGVQALFPMSMIADLGYVIRSVSFLLPSPAQAPVHPGFNRPRPGFNRLQSTVCSQHHTRDHVCCLPFFHV
ncbi:uncharacterized protein BDZ99DRAFT_25805 [Mytilinidion resinicola]|uniref:Uncharacterized protein n=1 Tax=Mytilinidion resinicola TaxID=574789 RepID=A0A6A6YL68_9PEZI|nr:uncharacterized protein BDZ99DRAFT_25805 [Mytilinidion resinicola]KAF2809278.1 hypothetical protein BDZ99DRAFT_25805 [Mytilinidion resinicola]